MFVVRNILRILVLTVLTVGLVQVGHSASQAADRAVRNPSTDSPEYTIQQALLASLDDDEKRGFDSYLELVHPDAKENQIAVVQLRRYSWATFRKRARDYILNGTRGGYQVERQEPEKRTETTEHVRLFVMPVNNKKRPYASPVRLSLHEGRWLIRSNTL